MHTLSTNAMAIIIPVISNYALAATKKDKTRVYDDTYGTGELHTYLQALLALTKTNKGW